MEAGYYDQSHFVREIRLATGQAPNRLLGLAELVLSWNLFPQQAVAGT
jgi:AraC-like DNA-binding protein